MSIIKKLFIMRHAESLEDVEQTAYERIADEDMPLTDFGKEQAVRFGQQFANEIGMGKNLRVFLSPSKRVLQTAQLVVSGIPKHVGWSLVTDSLIRAVFHLLSRYVKVEPCRTLRTDLPAADEIENVNSIDWSALCGNELPITTGAGSTGWSWWNKYRCDENAPHEEQPSPRLRHTGVDWPAAVGEPVYAVRDGIVRYAQTHATDGGFVVVEHDGQWTSICTHVIPEVSESTNGQPTTVRRGEQIGSIAPHTLPHLHFQVRLELYDTIWSPIGRLPEKTCWVVKQARNEPGFPEKFIDPKCLDWE